MTILGDTEVLGDLLQLAGIMVSLYYSSSSIVYLFEFGARATTQRQMATLF